MAWLRFRSADSARRYVNTETGEIISRRQYDARFKLPQQGYRSYEQKAASRRAAGIPAGPARGRRAAPLRESLRPPGRRQGPRGKAHGVDRPNPSLGVPTVRHITSKNMADHALSLARDPSDRGQFDPAARLKIVLYDTEGGEHQLGSRGGIRPELLQEMLRTHGTWTAAIAALADALGYDIDDWDFSGEADVYYVSTYHGL